MALTIIKGTNTIGNTALVDLKPEAMGVIMTIQAGNDIASQNKMNTLNAVLQPMEMEFERKDGSAISVETGSPYFMKGNLTTDAPEFATYKANFDLNRSSGYNVVSYNYDEATKLAAARGEINLEALKSKQTRDIMNTYTKKYLPYSRLKAMITGTSVSSSIPTDDAGATSGAAAFARAYGWARGEDYSDFLTVVKGDALRNFYRTTVTATFATTDVNSLVDDLRAVDSYSGMGIIALAHPRTVSNYITLAAADSVTKDSFVFGNTAEDGVRSVVIDGVHWVGVETMHPDFPLFYDMGMVEEMLVRGVEAEDVRQRGIGIIYEKQLDSWSTLEDLDGAKLRIFPEEWYNKNRLAGGILDVSGLPDRFHATGEMQDGAGASVEALEAWVTKLNGTFEKSE